MDEICKRFLEIVQNEQLPLSAISNRLGLNYYKAKLTASKLENEGKVERIIQEQKVVFKRVE